MLQSTFITNFKHQLEIIYKESLDNEVFNNLQNQITEITLENKRYNFFIDDIIICCFKFSDMKNINSIYYIETRYTSYDLSKAFFPSHFIDLFLKELNEDLFGFKEEHKYTIGLKYIKHHLGKADGIKKEFSILLNKPLIQYSIQIYLCSVNDSNYFGGLLIGNDNGEGIIRGKWIEWKYRLSKRDIY